MIPRDTLAFRAVLDAARQRTGAQEPLCRTVLEFLCTAGAVHGALHRQLAQLNLNDLKFAVLVALFVLDPSPATPADLASHTGATRSAMTDVLDHLETHLLVVRERDTHDRRLIYVHLTPAGRDTADDALNRYLRALADIARDLDAPTGRQLLSTCAQLEHGALPSPSSA